MRSFAKPVLHPAGPAETRPQERRRRFSAPAAAGRLAPLRRLRRRFAAILPAALAGDRGPAAPSSAGLRDEEADGLRIEPGELCELDRVEPPLPRLRLRHERLRPADGLGDLSLSQASIASRLAKTIQQRLVRGGVNRAHALLVPVAATRVESEGRISQNGISGGGALERVRILVVDDEATLREVVEEGLRDEGLDVVAAASAREALDKFEAGERWDLLLLDDQMPEVTGRQLLGLLRARGLETPAVFCSGTLSLSAAEQAELGVVQVLRKPLGLRELADAVRAAVDAEAVSSGSKDAQ